MHKNEHLIKSRRVAEILRVDVRTVHRLADSGELPHVIKVPGRTGAYLFDPDMVEMFRRQRETAA